MAYSRCPGQWASHTCCLRTIRRGVLLQATSHDLRYRWHQVARSIRGHNFATRANEKGILARKQIMALRAKMAGE